MQFTSQYLLLAFYWVVFGVFHSLLATDYVKRLAMRKMKNGYTFYRLFYSLFATVLVILIVWYHVSCTPVVLWQSKAGEKIIACLAATTGLAIMLVCISKYFLDLSGIDVLLGKKRPQVLQKEGLHRYVRHPLYFGTLLFVWAIFFFSPFLNNLLTCVCITLYTITGTFLEEKRLLVAFGEEYRRYSKAVPMLFPRVVK